MAKHFRLQRSGKAGCQDILKRSQYADYPIGEVCKVSKGWTYSYVGTRATMGPVPTKTGAIKKALRSYQYYIGNRSALLDGARRKRHRRR